MKHPLFDFTGNWHAIDEVAARLFKIYDAVECYSAELSVPVPVAVAIYRPSNSLNWVTVFRNGTTWRFYYLRRGLAGDGVDYAEAKNFAERLLVGFSLFGENSLNIPLL